jgi:hypothetical protein
MNSGQRGELWGRLVNGGIASGDLPDDAGDMTPWYVRAMIGTAAWIAALFLVLSIGVGLAELLKSPMATGVAGLIICAAAIALMRADPAGVFASQLALAGSLAGQALVAYALLHSAHWSELLPWFWLGAFETVLVILAPNYLHRVLSTLGVAVAASFALVAFGWWSLFPALVAAAFVAVQLNEARLASRAALWQPVATGLALAAVFSASGAMFGPGEIALLGVRRSMAAPQWVGGVAIASVLIAAVWALLRDADVPAKSRVAIATWVAVVALAAAAWPVPGLTVALIVMLVAFATGHTALLGFAILAMLGALGHYYYSLQTTLLAKSGALLATGLVLLAFRGALHWFGSRGEGGEHA